MPTPTVSLPVLATDHARRLTPTDVTQFVRLEQCERFLRLRLAERAGQDFMKEYDVIPQRMTPLLSLSGHTFEEGIESDLAKRAATVNYATKYAKAHNRPENNTEVVDEARRLVPGQSMILLQPRLEAELGGWRLRGDVDLVRMERAADGTLRIFIGDMKSTVEVKVEHRLQVAFYRLMLEHILQKAGIGHDTIQTGILYRPPADPTPEDEAEIQPLREAARQIFGLADALLEVVADPEAYLQSAHDLVLSQDSTARRVAATEFDAIPYSLSFKCDGCLYNEFCMKWSAETEDLSLLPYMTGTDKDALRKVGITTVQSLATLKEFAPTSGSGAATELVPAPGREAQVKQIAATWSVGPRLDELIHRAKSFRRSVRRDGTQALSYIPGKGNSTLPIPDWNASRRFASGLPIQDTIE
jgi:predicted RecB family nuclease